MVIKKQIIELLTKKELTALEISAELGVPKKRLWSYLSILLNTDKKIEIVNDKKPYKYKAITPKALLKQLHSIMNKRMDFVEEPSENEIQIIKTIEEMIK